MGCTGSCTYSIKRNYIFECEEGKWLAGFIETSKGVCELCNETNKGCLYSNYNKNYPNGYSKDK